MADPIALAVADALDLLGAAYRGDWSDFDGRTLRLQLADLSGLLREDAGEFSVRRWAFGQAGICPESRCWQEHCSQRAATTGYGSCDHAEAYFLQPGIDEGSL